MSETFTVKLSREALETLAEKSREHVGLLKTELAKSERELENYTRMLAPKQETLSVMPAALAKDTKDGRAKKGESERVILGFLAENKPHRFAASVIINKTGVSATSTWRTLLKLEHAKKVTSTKEGYAAA